MTRTQDAQPAVVNEDATTLVDDRAHWRASGNLRIKQRTLASVVVGRRQNLDRIGGLANPLLNQRPARVVSANQFVERLH